MEEDVQQVNIGSFSSSEKENLVVDIILAFFFLFLPHSSCSLKKAMKILEMTLQKSTWGIKVFWDIFVVLEIFLEII